MPAHRRRRNSMLTLKQQKLAAALLATAVVTTVLALRLPAAADPQDAATPAAAKASGGNARFFEMRTYYAAEGKMDALNARFRNHTNKLFAKHGMDLVGYWQPVDKKDVLV